MQEIAQNPRNKKETERERDTATKMEKVIKDKDKPKEVVRETLGRQRDMDKKDPEKDPAEDVGFVAEIIIKKIVLETVVKGDLEHWTDGSHKNIKECNPELNRWHA